MLIRLKVVVPKYQDELRPFAVVGNGGSKKGKEDADEDPAPSGSIQTTPEHPFWVIGKDWSAAIDLQPGDLLFTRDRTSVTVVSVVFDGSPKRVYNFEVQGTHNYFVSSADGGPMVNVHNQCNKWKFGDHKSDTKWKNQMNNRDWTNQQIDEAIAEGPGVPAENMVNPGNSATRYVHPSTGRSVVVDNVTNEILHVGGDGFLY
jgi:hypothetical protein